MKQLVVIDEKITISQELYTHFKPLYRKRKKLNFNKAYFVSDSTFLCDYLLFAVNKANAKYPIFDQVTYFDEASVEEYRKNSLEVAGIPVTSFKEFQTLREEKAIVFFFLNCGELKSKTDILEKLNKVFTYMKNNRSSRCLISVMLPAFESFNSSATSLAEREFNFFLEKVCKKTPEIEYYLEVEKLCRENVRENDLDISLLRFSNVFSPDCYHTHNFDIKTVLNKCFENKKVTICDEDFKDVFSLSYVRDACVDIFASLFSAKKGHVYNVAAAELSLADIKEEIYKANVEYFSIEKNLSSDVQRSYSCLNCLKFDSLNIESKLNLSAAVKHMVSYITELAYDTSDNVAFYCGRIEQIQALEIEMLKEIDRICVENEIKYFLAGGTLLGAVRSGEVIPWDDDLDIGMLREDYDKFREVCKTQLSDKFSYSCPFNGSGSHYTTEKIRLESTYFSTRYSSKNVYSDGVFIDILVYDQTSNIKLFQKLQTFILGILYNCVILRWNYLPWKNRRHGIVKLIVPFLKLIPWGVYHGLFEFFSKIYKNKKDAKWLIDTVGKKLKHGPLPKEGLEDTVYVDFNGIKAPIPVDYTGYLNYAYGPDYMEKPNLSNRRCPHNFARIDLGKYIFDEKGETEFRDVDIRGELFESEDEK